MYGYLSSWFPHSSNLQELQWGNEYWTSCARGDTICVRPLQVDNIFVFILQVAVLFLHNNIFILIRQVAPVPACWLFKTSATSWPLTFWPWKWCQRHVWLCANLSLPSPPCSWVRPDVSNRRQTDRRQTKASLNASAPWGQRHNNRGTMDSSYRSRWPYPCTAAAHILFHCAHRIM